MAIRKRLVINFTGYEGLRPNAVRDRYLNSAADFDQLWHATTSSTPMAPAGGDIAAMTLTTTGADWETETEFVQFGTAGIFEDYAARSVPTRFASGLSAFLDIILSGTFYRYWRTSWRFCLFFLWPFALACFLVSFLVAAGLAPLFLESNPWHLAWTIPAAAIICRILIRWPGDRLFFSYLLDDWAAASDRIHGRSALQHAAKLRFAEMFAEKLRASEAEEIVVVAHSLGTVPAVEAMADLWRSNPELMRKKPISLVAAGSCLLMIALHPRAAMLREDVRLLLEESPLLWTEFQAVTDIIHFYRSDPAVSLGIRPKQAPIIKRIGFKNIHRPARYGRAKNNFFKMHLLFLKGAQIRNEYDMGMFVQGPIPFRELVTTYAGEPAPLDDLGRLAPARANNVRVRPSRADFPGPPMSASSLPARA
ncbi:alpha/beta hydrolase [Phyllobacterium sp. 0TCS1.6C]|uniref:alpha/beta hydrolase n=1 Tax=unclassified Phyllobacterium TaxID=2638441 RepID=UPI0022649BAD|nr:MULTISPECIES: alpha/beta hydrolase [unclassified Phyllobacterium]MCX8281014.1 alpha/beta hydrolase [Phyllobacterium sp. 0TCS1.6C]MCX8295880.1 alpha/beta hydrolase [Phyllobacterium sp. 0TCS1.6A]